MNNIKPKETGRTRKSKAVEELYPDINFDVLYDETPIDTSSLRKWDRYS